MSVKENIQNPQAARKLIRSGDWTEQTSGLAAGYVQGNLVILPQKYAFDFLKFCFQNPKPCPIVGIGEAGNPALDMLGDDIDIRYDVPKYRVFENGVMRTVDDIADVWQDDLVTFVIGCSYSFEGALQDVDLDVRHITMGRNVPMYRTNIQTEPTGAFKGELVVTMRPFNAQDAITSIQVSGDFARVHGAPIHLGDPAEIGITDLSKPDYGDPVDVKIGEIPVFWACGVTPQVAVHNADIPFFITHEPGCMLITDIKNSKMSLS
ncbi:putative hydro-lyase [Terasakiella sp. A23]|uniref:putative hydro-lyase n=1 Tax=Terasakiella sp. FCG-A23 TaxID=3080561 RepID=UPI00295533E5|nr:putative hydro-lyase [Terasakiella sp. A23]MDV7339179.1 putative hydro-lyase [Terasakiella sp. A23]